MHSQSLGKPATSRGGAENFGTEIMPRACLQILYANWLIMWMVALIHTASITFPVLITLRLGAIKLREQSIISEVNYRGPKLLASFETAVADPVCAKFFRRYLTTEFTLLNLQFMVDIENYRISIYPHSQGILAKSGRTTTTTGSFARGCHTVNAWETYSGNMPISTVSVAGRGYISGETDVELLVLRARNLVKKYFSDEYWHSLYDKKQITQLYREVYRRMLSVQAKAVAAGKWEAECLARLQRTADQGKASAILSLEESAELAVKQQQMLRKMFTLFDDVEELVYTSLRSNSYPQFVQSTIGAELRKLLEAGAHTV
jgi:hypothetical protein